MTDILGTGVLYRAEAEESAAFSGHLHDVVLGNDAW